VPSDDWPWHSDDARKVRTNPMHCLLMPPVISEGQGFEAKARLIRELGPEAHLRQLLDTIKATNEQR
jgi:hypothetical protein